MVGSTMVVWQGWFHAWREEMEEGESVVGLGLLAHSKLCSYAYGFVFFFFQLGFET